MAEVQRAESEQLRVVTERELVASLVVDTWAPVVEVGAGACACLTVVLAGQGFRILAIDRNPEAAADARRVLAEAGLLGRVAVAQADAARLPLRPGSIRTVVAFDTFHHVEDLNRAVAEIARVLHPCGRLVVGDWDEAANGFLERLTRALRGHFRKVTITPREIRRVYVCEQPRRRGWRHVP